MIDSSTEVIFLHEAYSNLLDIDDWKIICRGGFTSHDVKWKKAQGFHQYVHHLPAGDGLRRGIQQCNEKKAQQVLLQKFAPRWTGGQPVALRACHGLHCLGPKDGSHLLHRHIDAEGLVACEQAHLFGYREPAKWACLQAKGLGRRLSGKWGHSTNSVRLYRWVRKTWQLSLFTAWKQHGR